MASTKILILFFFVLQLNLWGEIIYSQDRLKVELQPTELPYYVTESILPKEYTIIRSIEYRGGILSPTESFFEVRTKEGLEVFLNQLKKKLFITGYKIQSIEFDSNSFRILSMHSTLRFLFISAKLDQGELIMKYYIRKSNR
jgi:hypothetical protein